MTTILTSTTLASTGARSTVLASTGARSTVLPSTGTSLIPVDFNYDAAIQARQDAMVKLQDGLNKIDAEVDRVMAFITDKVPCEFVDEVLERISAYMQPLKDASSKISGAMSQIKKEIDYLICRKNFPPGFNSMDCLSGEQTQGSKSLQGKSGSAGGNGGNGRDASQLTRAQRLLDCQANGANGSRGAAGGK